MRKSFEENESWLENHLCDYYLFPSIAGLPHTLESRPRTRLDLDTMSTASSQDPLYILIFSLIPPLWGINSGSYGVRLNPQMTNLGLTDQFLGQDGPLHSAGLPQVSP
ncbi:hypothetical protein VNO77_03512 [Canavalia gladiata]|uniref:Uncharacterized protein n=1 Tax=Canavalia gladiata TaxID=3824 RepID=A0AAN9MZZ8_CANGL